jgi:ribA/ribD-fused uncharacterized protein
MEIIDTFYDEHRYLSNFYGSYFFFYRDKVKYEAQTVEHAYQAMKANNTEAFLEILNCDTPLKAKRLGGKVKLKDNWDGIKDAVMMQMVRAKFSQNKNLREKLISTYPSILIEGNTWNDTYWGMVEGKGGQNKLGNILMAIREELRK